MIAAKPHVLVVDDDGRLRRLLQQYLAEHGFYVTVAADVPEAERLVSLFAYDLLIVDVMMPGVTGLEWVLQLRQRSQVPVLMLSALGEAEDRIRGLEAGVDDYLPKPFEPKELLLRMEMILKRARPVAQRNVLSFGPFLLDRVQGKLTRQGVLVHLSSAEMALLLLLSETPGEAMSRDRLFARLQPGGNERTIDVQVTRLRRKLEEDPKRAVYVRTMRGEGYALCIH